MELVVRIHIEALPEGVFLATSEDIQGLIAQGRTVAETLEIARDVAKKIIEDHDGFQPGPTLPSVNDQMDFSIIVGA